MSTLQDKILPQGIIIGKHTIGALGGNVVKLTGSNKSNSEKIEDS